MAAPRSSKSCQLERFESVPLPMREALVPFQAEGVKFALAHNGRALIADEMGVGKTLQAIAVATCYQVQGPISGSVCRRTAASKAS